VINVENCDLTGLNVVNIGAANAKVTVTGGTITCNDKNEKENYGALNLNKDAAGATLTVSGTTFDIKGDSQIAVNGAEGGSIVINGDSDVAELDVAVVEYGNYYYGFSTLAGAIAYAKAGETVKLIRDIQLTEGVTVAKGAEVTLDLNGKTVSLNVEATKTSALITNNGTLTITDSAAGGKLSYASGKVSTGYSTSTIINNGTLTVDGGIIENTSAKGGAPYAIDNYNTLTVNGGELTANGSVVRQAQFGNYDNTAVFNGGTLTSGYAGLQLHVFSAAKKTTTEINGGTFNGDGYAMYSYFTGAAISGNTEITIAGGTFNGEAALFLYNGNAGGTAFDAEIKGGTFNGEVYAYVKNAEGEQVHLPVVSGGTFSDATVEDICADGFFPVANEDGTYSVGYRVAAIGETKYETLAEAFEHAEDGKIVLLTDIELTEGVTVAKDAEATLDLNGKTVSLNVAAAKASAVITNNGKLTITDSVGGGKLTFASSVITTDYSISTIINNGTLTVEDGIFENTTAAGQASAYAIDNYNTLTVNGGKFTSSRMAIRQAQFANHDNTVTINGGEFSGYAGLQVNVFSAAKKTTTVINGGSFSGTYAMYTTFYKAEDAGNTDITIHDGTFTGSVAALFLYNGKAGGAAFQADVKGGTFNGGVYAYIKNADGEQVDLPVVSGGTFSEPVAETICAEGFIPTENEDGNYGVKIGYYVAIVGETKYETLAEAIAAAAEGETVTVIHDVTESQIVEINKPITLDGNGYKLSTGATRAINVTGADGVTVKNLTVETTGERGINVSNGATNVTIENVDVTAASNALTVENTAPSAIVTVTNSTLTGLDVVSVSAEKAAVTISDSKLICNDVDAKKSFAALTLTKEATGASIVANGITFDIRGDSAKAKCDAADGNITIDGHVEVAKTVEIDHNYIALKQGDTYTLEATVTPAGTEDTIVWSVEGEGIISVSQDGVVEALAEGTDYVLATVSGGNKDIVARCRVDVTKGEVKISAAQLSTSKVTTELFSTNYAKLDVILLLDQNDPEKIEQPEAAAFSGKAGFVSGGASFTAMNAQAGEEDRDAALAIQKAEFANEKLAGLFTLELTDDRTLMIVPTAEAIAIGQETPSKIASSYSTKIKLTIRDEEIETSSLTLTVKKTKPAVTASVSAFNSFYTEEERNVTFKGATVTAVALRTDKTVPAWLTLEAPAAVPEEDEDGTLWMKPEDLRLLLNQENVPTASTSGNIYLKVKTAEWAIPDDVTLTVKNTYKARSLKLASTSVSISEDVENSLGFTVTLKPGSSKETLETLQVKGVEVPKGYTLENFDVQTGAITMTTVKHISSEKIKLYVTFHDTDTKLPLSLTVKQVPVKFKWTPSTLKLNTLVEDSISTVLTATPVDYAISGVKLNMTDKQGMPIAWETFEGLDIDFNPETGNLTVATTDTTAPNTYYYLYATAGSSRVKLTIQTIGKTPTLSLKTKGSIDLSFPDTTSSVITTTLANCNLSEADKMDVVIVNKKGVDVTENFNWECVDNTIVIEAKDTLDTTGTYTAKVTATLNADEEEPIVLNKSTTFSVKRTTINVKLSASKVTLNKKTGDVGVVKVTCTNTKYNFVEPFLTYDEDLLTVDYVDGSLYVGLKDAAAFGKTYKVTVRAHEGAPAKTLSVAVLKESAKITSTIKASGSVDVIRDNTKITITPKYTNVLNMEALQQVKLEIFSNANKDNYKTPIAEENLPFDITVNENGVYTLTANEKLNHNVKYKARLVAVFAEGETMVEAPSAKISLTAKMGSAKLKLYAPTVKKLYAKDINSRVEFSIASTDASVNDIKSVELVESKLSKSYRGIFDLIEYENGEYAIGFAEGANVKKVAGKTITVYLKTIVDGNETTTSNGTLTIKITVAK